MQTFATGQNNDKVNREPLATSSASNENYAKKFIRWKRYVVERRVTSRTFTLTRISSTTEDSCRYLNTTFLVTFFSFLITQACKGDSSNIQFRSS